MGKLRLKAIEKFASENNFSTFNIYWRNFGKYTWGISLCISEERFMELNERGDIYPHWYNQQREMFTIMPDINRSGKRCYKVDGNTTKYNVSGRDLYHVLNEMWHEYFKTEYLPVDENGRIKFVHSWPN